MSDHTSDHFCMWQPVAVRRKSKVGAARSHSATHFFRRLSEYDRLTFESLKTEGREEEEGKEKSVEVEQPALPQPLGPVWEGRVSPGLPYHHCPKGIGPEGGGQINRPRRGRWGGHALMVRPALLDVSFCY